MATQIQLQEPILDGGISTINFFNGRLLTAQDLTREKAANREADRRIGRAIGDGVAYGLEVSVSPESRNDAPALQIEAGLALNRLGHTLSLRDRITLALVRPANAGSAGSTFFAECQPLQTGTYIAGQGVYLLTIAPAQTRAGRALTSGLGNEAASCNTDTIIEAVQFRLIQIDPFLTDGELQDEARLRNRLAYRCFGVTQTNTFISNPFGPPLQTYGLIDELRSSVLSDCDVPLAMLYWTLSGGIRFVDMWAVRRRLTKRAPSDRRSPLADDRRASEGEAMFLQFQEHVDELLIRGAAQASFVARQNFRYLPPVGIIPEAVGARRNGFEYRTFFSGLTYRSPVFIESARVEPLIHSALRYTPLDLTSGEMFWLYHVRENRQAIDRGGANIPQSYLIFTSGHLPFFGEARFDVARWGYSNYSSVLDK